MANASATAIGRSRRGSSGCKTRVVIGDAVKNAGEEEEEEGAVTAVVVETPPGGVAAAAASVAAAAAVAAAHAEGFCFASTASIVTRVAPASLRVVTRSSTGGRDGSTYRTTDCADHREEDVPPSFASSSSSSIADAGAQMSGDAAPGTDNEMLRGFAGSSHRNDVVERGCARSSPSCLRGAPVCRNVTTTFDDVHDRGRRPRPHAAVVRPETHRACAAARAPPRDRRLLARPQRRAVVAAVFAEE